MRILVLGAAGKAAAAVIPILRFLPGVEHIYLADRDAGALCKHSSELAHIPVSLRYLDAESDSGLRERMKEADLVLGCLGPFHLHESRIAMAAIATGRDYLSMCDDPDSAAEVLALGKEAERGGVRVLCGCGLTPGLSDLLACRATSRLDVVDSLELAWFLDLESGLGLATLEHLLRSFAGKAPVRKEGSQIKARAGSWEQTVGFPPPVGMQVVSHLSHPEPMTLAGVAAGIGDIWFKAGVGSRAKALALQSLARMYGVEGNDLWKAAVRAVTSGMARMARDSLPAALRVTASGAVRGAPIKRTLGVVGDYYRISALVMAAAVDGMVRNAWEPGVCTPDRVLGDPELFAWLRRAGVNIMVGEG
jgi:short subunit dehydrogenase-like uncharacterized protein